MVAEEEEEQHQLSPLDQPTEAAHQECSWPAIRFDVPSQRAYHFHTQFRTDQKPNNFLKGVKWSPDGTCLVSSSEDNTLRVFALCVDIGGNLVALCRDQTRLRGGDDGTNASSSDVDQGIMSAIAFSPAHTGMLATGSYSQTTAIYREDNMELLYVTWQQGGVIHDPFIMYWDVWKAVDVVYK
ncbi:hypothetical protein NL676_007903 [Syzygium grande]|nr:hypothetical protein NL676_007903 [Syzygium grande]